MNVCEAVRENGITARQAAEHRKLSALWPADGVSDEAEKSAGGSWHALVCRLYPLCRRLLTAYFCFRLPCFIIHSCALPVPDCSHREMI